MVENGEEVYVCLLHHPPGTVAESAYREIMGVVPTEEDAEVWAEFSGEHRYETRTLGMVSDY